MRSCRTAWLLLSLSIVSFGSRCAQAQSDPNFEIGLKPFGSYEMGNIDTVNLGNGSLGVDIPLISYPQRGGKLRLDLDLQYFNGSTYYQTLCYQGVCFTAPYGSQAGFTLIDKGNISTGSVCSNNQSCTAVKEPNGALHAMGAVDGKTNLLESVDASGYMAAVNSTSGSLTSITDSAGTNYYFYPSGGCPGDVGLHCAELVSDANGNQIYEYGQYDWLDTMGRTIPYWNVQDTNPSDFVGCTGTQPVAYVYLWNPPGVNGGTYPIKFCYFNTNTYPSAFELESVVLPNNTAWTFAYQELLFYAPDGNYYAPTLSQITFPTGGTISYTWGGTLTCSLGTAGNPGSSNFAVATRALNPNDGVDPVGTTSYSYSGTQGTATIGSGVQTTIVTDPSGNDTVHTFGLGGCYLFETQSQSYQGSHTGGTLLKTVNTTYSYYQPPIGVYGQQATLLNLVPTKAVTILANGQQTQITNAFDTGFKFRGYSIISNQVHTTGSLIQGTYGKEISRGQYDFGNGAPGSLLRTTTTSYLALTNSTYAGYNLLDLLSSVKISDGGGTQRAYTTYGYDQYSLASSGVTTHHVASPNGTSRGNLTSTARWLNTTSTYLTSTNTFFDTGTVNVAKDPKLNPRTIAYSSTYIGAYPTTVTNALNQATTNTYDFNTGLLTSTTDPNNKTTSYQYDNMLRPTQINNPDGGQAAFSYPNTNQVNISETINSTTNRLSYLLVDGVGRQIRQAVTNGETLPYDEADICYDGLGRGSFNSYPFQDSGPFMTARSCASPELGDTMTYDGLSRTTKVTHSDGGFVSYSYSGSSTTVTDEQGKTRQSTDDGLGRVTQVIEDPGVSPHLNYSTAYAYDALDNLTGVTQASSRQRTFVYDSLSHLTSSTNPESNWSPANQLSVATTYSYDANGNLINKTEPTPNQQSTLTTTLTYCYDPLNRMTAKGYTSQTCTNGWLPTPVATYVYDGGALPSGCSVGSFSYGLAIGNRTAICDAAGSEAWSYNIVAGTGWQITDQRTTNALTKTAIYQDNLLSLPSSIQYPSGRTINYVYNLAGRPISAVDQTTTVNYANAVHYSANGSQCWAAFGGAATAAETFNGRLQPQEIQANAAVVNYPGTGCPGLGQTGSLLDLSYSFNYGSGDNGNVMGITNNIYGTRSQAFNYDQLNRITVGETTSTYSTSPANCWGESYQYDNQAAGGAWGNLTNIGVASSAYNGCTQEGLSVTATAQNRISNGTTIGYDTAGNMTTTSSATYSYDAENHLTSTAGVNFTYDGDGKRVEKSNGKIYWYGIDGSVLDETDLTGSTTNGSFSEYVLFNGRRTARRDFSNNVFYYVADHLGTSRTIVQVPSGQNAATLCYDADFYPFGGERSYTNSCGPNYKFTGQERDAESGLDNFSARFEASFLGRFVSADPMNAGASLFYPQSWNMYNYVSNRPLIFTDPTGKECVWDDGSYDAQDDLQTGSVGDCQAVGGTWVELGQNGNWSAQSNAALGNLVTAIQNGQVSSVTVTNSDGGQYTTSYNSSGQAIQTVTPSGSRLFGYSNPRTSSSGSGAAVAAGTTTVVCVLAEPCGEGEAAFVTIFVGVSGLIDTYKYFSKKRDIKQADDAWSEIQKICADQGVHLNDDHREQWHEAITGQGLGYGELVNMGVELFCPGAAAR